MSDVDPPDPDPSIPQETHSDPFGDVLPERSRDEEPDAWGERVNDDDQRLRDEVPPHHG
jgi:hypothetical protein